MNEYQLEFNRLSQWARGEMAKLGDHPKPDVVIGSLWLIIDELTRQCAALRTGPDAVHPHSLAKGKAHAKTQR